MTIEVLIFGGAAMAAKSDRLAVSVSASPTVREVSSALLDQHPGLRSSFGVPRLAVNQEFAEPDCPIRPGDEVALITLVSGG